MLVFDDSGTGRLVPAAKYLSGKVRDKLKAAEKAADDDPRFEVNAQALHQALPPELGPSQIDAHLGAAWIDACHVQQFLREILDDPGLKVEHPGGSMWTVKATGTACSPRPPGGPDAAVAWAASS